ncbi:AsmA [invertebrate metagenome]|uniref:AsmA n=1 Tax=invertebrate metagenome TaxID=1711999 RepID=A0A484H767_9ZZZZ
MGIRPVFIVVLSIGFAVGSTCVAVLKMVDLNSYRIFISQKVTTSIGRSMIINGDLEMRLSRHPALVMHDVALANAPWGSRPNMMTAKQFEVQIALFPLLTGRIKIRRLTFIEPDIIVEITRDRINNWMFDTPTIQESVLSSHSPTTLPALHVTAITVRQARLVVLDNSAQKQSVLHTLQLAHMDATTIGFDSNIILSFYGIIGIVPIRGQGRVGAITDLLANRPFTIDLAIAAADTTFALTGVIAHPLNGESLDLFIHAYDTNLATMHRIEHIIA